MTAAGGTLFVTGMQRSGTTLVEKLLHAHPDLSVLSQPFPLLFVEAKRAFLESIELRGGLDERYPLGPILPEGRYRPADLRRFLEHHRLTAGEVAEVFARLAGSSWQYHRPDPERLAAALPAVEGRTLAEAAAVLWRAFSPKPEVRWAGGKETLCEELVPAFLAAGWRCVIVVRDPRDVLTSLNSGAGERHAGAPKPTLFNLRQWRKSVAVGLAFAGHPGLRLVRYEDVAERPAEVLAELAGWLEVAPVAPDPASLLDQAGRGWTGNSSHAPKSGVDAASVGRYRDLLPGSVRELVEAACGPEVAVLGYPAEVPAVEAEEVLRSFRDPWTDGRPELAAWAAAPERVEEEVERLRELRAASALVDVERTFLFRAAWERLREAAW